MFLVGRHWLLWLIGASKLQRNNGVTALCFLVFSRKLWRFQEICIADLWVGLLGHQEDRSPQFSTHRQPRKWQSQEMPPLKRSTAFDGILFWPKLMHASEVFRLSTLCKASWCKDLQRKLNWWETSEKNDTFHDVDVSSCFVMFPSPTLFWRPVLGPGQIVLQSRIGCPVSHGCADEIQSWESLQAR